MYYVHCLSCPVQGCYWRQEWGSHLLWHEERWCKCESTHEEKNLTLAWLGGILIPVKTIINWGHHPVEYQPPWQLLKHVSVFVVVYCADCVQDSARPWHKSAPHWYAVAFIVVASVHDMDHWFILCVAYSGSAADRIFVSSDTAVRGFNRKGKQFLTFNTNLTEDIKTM